MDKSINDLIEQAKLSLSLPIVKEEKTRLMLYIAFENTEFMPLVKQALHERLGLDFTPLCDYLYCCFDNKKLLNDVMAAIESFKAEFENNLLSTTEMSKWIDTAAKYDSLGIESVGSTALHGNNTPEKVIAEKMEMRTQRMGWEQKENEASSRAITFTLRDVSEQLSDFLIANWIVSDVDQLRKTIFDAVSYVNTDLDCGFVCHDIGHLNTKRHLESKLMHDAMQQVQTSDSLRQVLRARELFDSSKKNNKEWIRVSSQVESMLRSGDSPLTLTPNLDLPQFTPFTGIAIFDDDVVDNVNCRLAASEVVYRKENSGQSYESSVAGAITAYCMLVIGFRFKSVFEQALVDYSKDMSSPYHEALPKLVENSISAARMPSPQKLHMRPQLR